MKYRSLACLALMPAYALPNEGELDPGYGQQGRNATGFLESSTLVLRDVARSPASGGIWKFADDREDPVALYIARAFANGQPDTGFGPNSDGRRRTPVPGGLVPQAYGLDLAGALVQADGKPVVYGGLSPRNGSGGAFPGIVCRIAAAGNFEAAYGESGCRPLRSFLSPSETCRVTDVAAAPGDMMVAVGNCQAADLVERPFVTRITASGALDFEFGAGLALITPPLPIAQASSHRFQSVEVRPDGRILVLGEITRELESGLLRELAFWQFDGGGSPDPEFGSNGFQTRDFFGEGFPLASARDLALRPDGRLLALGEAQRAQDDARVALLAALYANGEPVPGFGIAGKRVDALGGIAGAASSLQRIELDAQGRAFVAGALVEGLPDARSHAGGEFWFQFPYSVPPSLGVRLRISADTATSGVITSQFQDTSVPFQVEPGIVTEVALSSLFNIEDMGPPSINPIALNLTAGAPVVVQAFGGRAFTTSSTALLPVEHLGREYRVQTWGAGLGLGSHVYVVAALPGSTSFTVRASVAAAGQPAGTPLQVVLQQGESYHLRADADDADMTGTTISAQRPVAVFGANSCANIPNSDIEFCDQTMEQMEPLDRWGTDFVGVPFATRSGDVFRVLAHESGTRVEIDGEAVATLAAGANYSFSRSSPVRIRTSRPAAVAQFAKGCKVDEVGESCPGDPAMLTLPPRSAWGRRHLAIVPAFGVWDGNIATYRRFLGIIVPQEALGAVTLDGAVIPAGDFAPIGDGRHWQVQLERDSGVDVVAAPVPISVSVYAFAAGGEGYAYQAANVPLTGDEAQSDDLVLRYTPAGVRDARFGVDGIVLMDHAAGYEAPLPSDDRAVRAVPDGVGVVVGSASINRTSDQAFALDYRLIAADLFRDGFESD
jgi:uncharacterized delta-60 repeat protein